MCVCTRVCVCVFFQFKIYLCIRVDSLEDTRHGSSQMQGRKISQKKKNEVSVLRNLRHRRKAELVQSPSALLSRQEVEINFQVLDTGSYPL